jgi:hypothetical protein
LAALANATTPKAHCSARRIKGAFTQEGGNATLIIFGLKNAGRAPAGQEDEWGEAKHSGAVGNYDLSKLSLEQLRELRQILVPIAAGIGDRQGDSEAWGRRPVRTPSGDGIVSGKSSHIATVVFVGQAAESKPGERRGGRKPGTQEQSHSRSQRDSTPPSKAGRRSEKRARGLNCADSH